jgi:hypothetical protein
MTNPCPHARSAAEFITTRAVLGVEKYGHTLADAGLSPARLVRHAREEAADLLVYLTALEAALSWQPIETAPRDGTAVDLWYVPPYSGSQRRMPDRWWVKGKGWRTSPGPDFIPDRRFTAWRHIPPNADPYAKNASPVQTVPMETAPEPERSGHYECVSDKPSGTWDEAFKPEPTDDLTEAVAAEMWRVYEASPIAREGSKGISWVRLKDLAASNPDKAPAVIRRVGLDEARAAIEVVRRYDAIAKPEPTLPAVTREAVERTIREEGELGCADAVGGCRKSGCQCIRQTDAIMALIGGAP